jgi:ATP-dependent Clp protease adaptor protein ClpS
MSTKRESDVLTKPKQVSKKPTKYKVLLHNDDYTTMEFVVSILMSIFHRDQQSSFEIMMHVHRSGIGIAGIYTKEVAETKLAKTVELARKYEFPLECTMEPE